MKLKLATVLATSIFMFSSLMVIGGDKLPYPNDYRDWTHVKSMLIKPGHPLENPFHGIHHIYANKKAMQGLKNGKYPNGSIFVFDLLKYTEKDNTIQESERKLLGVMHKNADKYTKTGGWGFEGFAGNSKTKRLTNDGGASCFACHAPQKNDDYIFSRYRH